MRTRFGQFAASRIGRLAARLPLHQRFYIPLAPLAAIGLLVAWLGWTGLNSNANSLIEARQVKELAISSLTLLLTQDDASKALLIDMENVDAGSRKIEAYDQAQKTFADMEKLTRSQAMLKKIRQLRQIDESELRPLDMRLLETMGAGKKEEANKLYFTEYEPIRAKYEAILREIVAGAEQTAREAASEMAGKNIQSFVVISVSLLVGLLTVAFFLLHISGSVRRELDSILSLLQNEANRTSSAGTKLKINNQRLAASASKIASSLEETSSSLEEISSVTRRNAESAEHAKTLAHQTRAATDSGLRDIQEMTTAVADIKKSSDSGVKIIKTIDEIALQTNLLALNAAIEAARAGEAGLGFAVVADEIRALAKRSATAAQETTAKIEEVIARSDRGVEISSQVSEGLSEIAEKIRAMDRSVVEIATATHEQSSGITHVADAVSEIDQLTQGNASAADEGVRAAEEMNAQAADLQTGVFRLSALVLGSRNQAAKEQPQYASNARPTVARTGLQKPEPAPDAKFFVADDSSESEEFALESVCGFDNGSKRQPFKAENKNALKKSSAIPFPSDPSALR